MEIKTINKALYQPRQEERTKGLEKLDRKRDQAYARCNTIEKKSTRTTTAPETPATEAP